MALAAARRPEQQDVGTLRQPSIAGRQRHHLSFRDHWDDLEVERGERLAGGQTRLGEMPFDAATATVGPLVLGERRKMLRDNLDENGCGSRSVEAAAGSEVMIVLMIE